jgi:hypothetical protein
MIIDHAGSLDNWLPTIASPHAHTLGRKNLNSETLIRSSSSLHFIQINKKFLYILSIGRCGVLQAWSSFEHTFPL